MFNLLLTLFKCSLNVRVKETINVHIHSHTLGKRTCLSHLQKCLLGKTNKTLQKLCKHHNAFSRTLFMCQMHWWFKFHGNRSASLFCTQENKWTLRKALSLNLNKCKTLSGKSAESYHLLSCWSQAIHQTGGLSKSQWHMWTDNLPLYVI